MLSTPLLYIKSVRIGKLGGWDLFCLATAQCHQNGADTKGLKSVSNPCIEVRNFQCHWLCDADGILRG